MFGSKYQAIFRSRWRALIWASGVLLTAYCSVPREDGSDPGVELLGAAVQVAGHGQQQEEQHHVNPWALPPEQQHH
ncbi:MAG: hypothetical protein KDE15_02600 [Erythrobacter sp.]|nr:hypothetical protein [Erythrobacter sp.]